MSWSWVSMAQLNNPQLLLSSCYTLHHLRKVTYNRVYLSHNSSTNFASRFLHKNLSIDDKQLPSFVPNNSLLVTTTVAWVHLLYDISHCCLEQVKIAFLAHLLTTFHWKHVSTENTFQLKTRGPNLAGADQMLSVINWSWTKLFGGTWFFVTAQWLN